MLKLQKNRKKGVEKNPTFDIIYEIKMNKLKPVNPFFYNNSKIG